MSKAINEIAMNTETVWIPDFRFETLKKDIEKLNRRARKLNLPEIIIEQTGETEVRQMGIGEILRDFDGAPYRKKVNVQYIGLQVTGESPKLPGWEFAASLDHEGETGLNIIKKNPFFKGEIPVKYRNCPSACDHCKKYRNRNDTFLLHHEGGDFVQIGRQCLKDFLGHAGVDNLIQKASFLAAFQGIMAAALEDDFDGDRERGIRVRPVYPTRDILATAFRCVEIDGGYRKKTENGEGTAQDVLQILHGIAPGSDSETVKWHEARTPIEDSLEDADAAIEWISSLGQKASELNDYEHNLYVAGSAQYAALNRVGILASAVAAYKRHLGAMSERKTKKNEYFGEIGSRLILKLTLIRSFGYDTAFGYRQTLIMEDEEGRCFIWKTSSAPDIGEGRQVTVKGTIKTHSTFKDRLQTELSRCAIQ